MTAAADPLTQRLEGPAPAADGDRVHPGLEVGLRVDLEKAPHPIVTETTQLRAGDLPAGEVGRATGELCLLGGRRHRNELDRYLHSGNGVLLDPHHG